MKRLSILTMTVVLVLMVAFTSCTTMQSGSDETYRNETAARRIYVDDPYYGTIVLERDPATGRYYQVSPYGYYGNPYNTYNPYGGYYGSYRNNRYYNNRYYRNNNQPRQQTQPSEQQRQEWERNRQEARKKILGN